MSTNNKSNIVRTFGNKISIGQLMMRSVARAGQYPVSTIVGVMLSYCATRLVALLPATSALAWYLRIALGFSLGLFLLSLLVALSALRGVKRPALLFRLGQAAIGSTAIGFITAVPVIGFALLVPQWFWQPVLNTWAYGWIDASIVACGALWIAAISPDMLIAWPHAVKSRTSLQQSLLFTWMQVEDGYFSPYRTAASIVVAGAILAFIPLVSLTVIPLLAHLSMVLYQSALEER